LFLQQRLVELTDEGLLAESDDMFASAAQDIFGDVEQSLLEEQAEPDTSDETPISTQVEDTFLAMIRRGAPEKILELTSMDHTSSIEKDLRSEFYGLYYSALSENPALAIYSKLAKEAIPMGLDENGELEVTFPYDADCLRFTDQVGNLLTSELRDTSPIVDALMAYREAAIANASNIADTVQYQRSDRDQEEGLDVSQVDFSDQQMKDVASGMGVDEGGGPFGQSVPLEAPKLEISLQDYSNKSIAEYLHKSEEAMDEDAIRQVLKDEQFMNSRINEIVAIWRYLKTNHTIESKISAQRNEAPGGVEFGFE
jgi:hypothetical protein